MATEAQIRALRIISDHNIERPSQFARLMWPDAQGWHIPGKCGHGSSSGVGMRLAGGAYLGKLCKAGLVRRWVRWPNVRIFEITPAGEQVLSEITLAKEQTCP